VIKCLEFMRLLSKALKMIIMSSRKSRDIPNWCTFGKVSRALCEKIMQAMNNNTYAAHKFRHEISVSIEKSALVSSMVHFNQAIKKAYDVHHHVHTLGILYYHVPLKPMLAMNMLIYRQNKVDFFGTGNSKVPRQYQWLQYS
jgi:hypothetical protein